MKREWRIKASAHPLKPALPQVLQGPSHTHPHPQAAHPPKCNHTWQWTSCRLPEAAPAQRMPPAPASPGAPAVLMQPAVPASHAVLLPPRASVSRPPAGTMPAAGAQAEEVNFTARLESTCTVLLSWDIGTAVNISVRLYSKPDQVDSIRSAKQIPAGRRVSCSAAGTTLEHIARLGKAQHEDVSSLSTSQKL
jgi:hypothetical protein